MPAPPYLRTDGNIAIAPVPAPALCLRAHLVRLRPRSCPRSTSPWPSPAAAWTARSGHVGAMGHVHVRDVQSGGRDAHWAYGAARPRETHSVP